MTVSNRRRTAVAGAGAACLALALAACGSSSGSGSPSPSSASTTSPPSAASGGSAGVHTAQSAGLGTIVVDGKGFTLYRFDKDSAEPSASHCTGACATLWPPAPAASAGTAKGIDHKLLGTVTRTDGTKQLTLNGWPLYTYSPDGTPGATNGQGVDGTWWAATPTGGKAAATSSGPSSPSASNSTSGGSYGY